MDYKNLSQKTLQESKNIPHPNKPTFFNLLFWCAFIVTSFALLFIFVGIPKIIENDKLNFFTIIVVLLFLGMGVLCFYLCIVLYKKNCDDYELSKRDFRQYQIKMQIEKERKQQIQQQQYQQHQAALNEYNRQQQAKAQRKQDLANGILKCPKCGSGKIATVNRGYTITTGFIGSGQAVNVCQVCGHRFKPGT